jgi:hypothetical protein
MKHHFKNLMKFGAVALLGLTFQNNSFAQCNTWEKHPQGAEAAKTQHVLYRDKFKEKKYDEAYPIWEELFKQVQIPAPNKLTHFSDGADMCFAFAKAEQDKTKKTEWIDKAIALYDQSAACNGEDATSRAYQAYYMYANGYDQMKAYKVFEKSMELGKENPPPMIMVYMSALAVNFYKNKVAGFDDKYMLDLYEKFKKITDTNVQKGKDAANYQKYWLELEKQYSQIPNIFGCDYWVAKLTPQVKVQWENPDSLKVIASKLSEKCGKDNELYKEVWARYKSVVYTIEGERQKAILTADSSTVYSKILAYRVLSELDTMNAVNYKSKEWALHPELATSSKEWIDNDTRGKAVYRYAFHLYKEGNFSGARTYCRATSKLLPNWGDPYILVGTMYASSGTRCSPATNGTGFDAQICVWPAIDEWVKAKSVDPSAADEANRLIGRYSGFMPTKSELAVRGIAEGSSFTVPCWIQQSTVARGI